ncbi:MAG: Ysh1p: subunit of polyadenylation factor I [Candidatus Hydrogenedentota bacterium]
MSTVTFTTVGGGSEIGANCFLLRAEGHDLLLDCGMHPKKEGNDALPKLEILQRAPEGVVVTHAHIDHCGAVPYLVKQFPSVECFATNPTVNIMDRMLHNSVSVMGILGEERGIREYPLYSHNDVEKTMRRCHGVRFNKDFMPAHDSPFRVRFQPAGHVLGSAGVIIKTRGHTVYYTGDVCANDQELMAGLKPLDDDIKVDTLIIESTRGTHEVGDDITYENEIERFGRELHAVLSRGGSVLVPSFALGRTQELLNVISRLQEDGLVPDVPVYASGLGRAIYEIYVKFREYLRSDAELRPLNKYGRIGDMYDPRIRKEILRQPGIIVATSGMMLENTPSSVLASEMVRHDKHAVFFVGYLDPDTLGYKLLHASVGDSLAFELESPPVEVRMANRQRFHFSAHATREELVEIIHRVKPKNAIFVHGETGALEWMRDNCNGVPNKFMPELGKTISLES